MTNNFSKIFESQVSLYNLLLSYVNAALLNVSELRSELVNFDAHLVSPKFFHGNVEFLLEVVVQRRIQRIPFADFASS